MTISLEYIGTAERYFETAATGKSQSWRRGQTQDVSDTDAALLMATGLFAYGGADAQAASNIAPGKPVTATTNLTGRISFSAGESIVNLPAVLKIPGIAKSILASLVVGATYGQSDNTVTVAATAHGLPTTKNGYKIFWPGSTAVAAGFYNNFQYVDANTFTFDNPTSQTVASGTAMTGSAVGAYISMGSITLPAGYLAEGETLTAKMLRSGSTVATKYAALYAASVQIAAGNVSTTPNIKTDLSAVVVNGKLLSSGAPDGVNSSATRESGLGITQDIPLGIRGNVSAVGSWMAIESLVIEVLP